MSKDVEEAASKPLDTKIPHFSALVFQVSKYSESLPC